jgi:hypothetical protein
MPSGANNLNYILTAIFKPDIADVEGKVKNIYLRFGNVKFNTHLLENT